MNALYPLGDDIGKVEVLEVLGSDLTVVNAARVSMAKESFELDPKDEKLIGYLAKHNHWTPFSHPQVQLRIKMPIFVARQWFKHMIGFTRNEVSRRYVDEAPDIYIPQDWRKRAPSVKQGSLEEPVDDLTRVRARYLAAAFGSVFAYQSILDSGGCPEQARMVLPQSMYTEFIETGSLAAYARLTKLRLDPHAQLEIRHYAQAVSDLINPLFPASWKALTT